LLLSKLKEGLPGRVVIDIKFIRVGWVNFETSYFIEINGGPVNRFAGQRSHQSFAPVHLGTLFDRGIFLDGALLGLFGASCEVFEQRANVEKAANRNGYRKAGKKNKT
jgi:hypothetical protein